MERVALYTYHYDPLDRLTGTKSALQSGRLRFYCQSRIATEIQGIAHHSIMQQGNQILAQLTRQANQYTSSLLATDLQRSVLQTTNGAEQQTIAYSPFGHHANEHTNTHLLGFNGERADSVTGHYLLGNGYRAFNPVLMRFNSPDSWSPFGKAGINAYAYCMNNPVLTEDPSGHLFGFVGKYLSIGINALRTMAQNVFLGGININPPGAAVHKLKIKTWVSVDEAYKARDAMLKHAKLSEPRDVANSELLRDFKIPIDPKTAFGPSLNLKYNSARAMRRQNTPTDGLPPPLKLFVDNLTPTDPNARAIHALKNGGYDPTAEMADPNYLYNSLYSSETRSYLNDLFFRTNNISQTARNNYLTLRDMNFIFRRQ